MRTLGRRLRINVFRQVATCLLLLLIWGTATAHNLNQRADYIGFDQQTLVRMQQRQAAGQPLIQTGDVVGLILKATPSVGTPTGAGGYSTFFIPVGTQVVGAQYGRIDSKGAFVVMPMKGQSILALGDGSVGAKAQTALKGLELGPNIIGEKAFTVDGSTGLMRGTMAGVYSDTGIFYSTDPKTAWQSWANMGGYDNSTATVTDNLITTNSGDRVLPTTRWDAEQLLAFGSTVPISPIVDNVDGRGNTPWGMGSPVAGPQSGYAWHFNKTYWDANASDAARMKNSVRDMGPWKRIQYPGSMIAKDTPGLRSTALGYVGVDASEIGYPLSEANPLPSTTSWSDTTSPKAVRMAWGNLELFRPEFARVQFKVLVGPGQPGSPFDAAGFLQAYGDTFGGDAGGEYTNKDHLWRYYEPTTVSLASKPMIFKQASRPSVAPNEVFTYTLWYTTFGNSPLTNVVVEDTLPAGISFVSAVPAPSSTGPLRWNLGTVPANTVSSIVLTVRATGTGILTNTVCATSDQGVKTCNTETIEVANNPLLYPAKSVTPSFANPGDAVTYTLTLTNEGTGSSAVPLVVREMLPQGFTYESLVSTKLAGSPTSAVSVNAADTAKPVFTVNAGIVAGASLVITFKARISPGQPGGVYTNSYTFEYDGKIMSTGALAPVTVGGSRIGDTVFRDWNGNGVKDVSDEGISGVIVQLFAADGTTLLKTVTTDGQGRYEFAGIGGGTYVVKVTAPASHTATFDVDGIASLNQATVVVADNQNRQDVDFGYRPGGSGSISGSVFNDVGRDGSYQSATDDGIAGVNVRLYRDQNGNGVVDAPGDGLLATVASSGATGAYSFSSLPSGLDYVVDVDQTASAIVTALGGTPIIQTTSDPLVISSLEGSKANAHFGFWREVPSSVGGTAFIDSNLNGVRDAGEVPVANLPVELYADQDGDGAADVNELIQSTRTSVAGAYLFEGVGAGDFLVVIDMESPEVPAGHQVANTLLGATVAAGENSLANDFPFSPLLTKTANRTTVQAADQVVYTIQPNYNGGDFLAGLTVTDAVPAGTTFVSAGQGGVQAGGTVTWDLGTTIPATAGTLTQNLNLYALRGNGTTTFWRYNPTTLAWQARANTPATVSSGGALVSTGTYIYALRGNGSTSFWRYNASTNVWSTLASTPGSISSGGRLVYLAPYIYALRGNGTTTFYRYDINANTWATRANLPGSISSGGSLAMDGTYIYALRGNGSKSFYRYDPTANTWTSRASTPDSIKSGGSLTFDGTNLYAFRGDDRNNFFRYNRTTNVWSRIANAPGTVNSGGSLAFGGSSLYALRGDNSTAFWRYSTQSNAWTTLASTPASINSGGALVEYGAPIPTELTVDLATDKTLALDGGSVAVSMTVSSSATNITGVSPPALSVAVTNGATATLLSGPTPASGNITAGGSVVFTWTYRINAGTLPGSVRFSNAAFTSASTNFPASASNSVLTTRPLTMTVSVNSNSGRDSLRNIAGIQTNEFRGSYLVANVGSGGSTSDQFIKFSGSAATDVGSTGTTQMRALVLSNDGVFLYGVDRDATAAAGADLFGSVNTSTGAFTAIGRAASAGDPLSGSLGDITVADIRGMAFDPETEDLYAVHRREDTTAGNTLLDCLFKIDPATGLHVNNAFGTGVDYLVIATNTLSTPLYDIDDISFDPESGQLYAIANDSTAGFGDKDRLVIIDTSTGAVSNVGRFMVGTSTTAIDGVQGMSFDVDGNLLVTTGTGGVAATNNTLWRVNATNAQCTAKLLLTSVLPAYSDYEAIASPVSSVIIPPTQSNPVYTGLTGSIGDLVYADINANGAYDAGEPGLAGVRITVRSGAVTKTATSDSRGFYRVFGLTANGGAPWTVSVDMSSLPENWIASSASTLQRTLASNSAQIDDADFGFFGPADPSVAASVSGAVWTDVNEDAVQDYDEALLAGARVLLYRDLNSNGTLEATDLLIRATFTNDQGVFSFTRLNPGAYLLDVEESTLPAGMTLVSGGSAVRAVTLAALQNRIGVNFGYNHTGSIGDTVFYDLNVNGVQDAGESGIPNVRVSVYEDANGNGSVDADEREAGISLTNASGVYTVGKLAPGQYVTRVDEQHVPAPSSSPNAGLYNTMLPTRGEEIGVTLAASQAVTNVDFGFAELGLAEGHVFHDANSDGHRNPGEVGLPNITVTATGTVSGGGALSRTAVTDVAGEYDFLLPTGSYVITFDSADADFPSGMTRLTTVASHTVVMQGGWEMEGLDFGRTYTGALGGTLFADTNGNGTLDGGEGGIVGAVVELFDAAGSTWRDARVTGSNGSYRFDGLANGAHVVKVRADSLTAIQSPTITADPVAPLDGIASATISSGASILNLNFGYKPALTVPPSSACPAPKGQTVGSQYMVTRVGKDILGGQSYQHSQCIMGMSPNGRWVTGVRFGTTTRGFLINTLTSLYSDVTKVTPGNVQAAGTDVNDAGDVVGYEKWTSGANANMIPWYRNRAASTTQRLTTPFDANPSITASPVSITNDSTYAFGSVDPDGPGGAQPSQGGYWSLSTRAWTPVTGWREVLDVSADATVALVVNSSGQGQILRGTVGGGWSSVVVSFSGKLKGGKVSPNGRYIGSAETVAGVPVPFVYDTLTGTRTNLPRAASDTLGGIVGAISDTARVLGSIYRTGGSAAVLWESPASSYTTLMNVLSNDGHLALDSSYFGWNIYNGGDGMSADGRTFAVYGNNIFSMEDSLIFQSVGPVADRLCLGNAVWSDTNSNGIKEVGEPGVAGVVLRIFATGDDAEVGGSGTAADYEALPPVTTTSSGAYTFSPLPAGTYYITLTPTPALPVSSGAPDLADNGQDNDNNGRQPGGPGTLIYSPVVTLQPGTEPVNDGDSDANTDFSQDFGLTTGLAVGDLVWEDKDDSGLYESANQEKGVRGITVQLLNASTDAVLMSTTTDANGAYMFGLGSSAGNYKVRIPFLPSSTPLTSTTVGSADNGVDHDNNGAQPGTGGSTVTSMSFNLTMGAEPGTAGGGNFEKTLDIGVRACPVLDISPASLPAGVQDTAYSQSLTAGGASGAVTWQLASGSLPEGLSLSSSGVISGTPVLPGVTIFTVQAVDFKGCTGSRSYALTVSCPVMSIMPASLPVPAVGVAYSQALGSSGGRAPYAYSVTSGSLPAGLTLSAEGVIFGTVVNAATATFTVTSTDVKRLPRHPLLHGHTFLLCHHRDPGDGGDGGGGNGLQSKLHGGRWGRRLHLVGQLWNIARRA